MPSGNDVKHALSQRQRNPWSAWSRFLVLLVLIPAIWHRSWPAIILAVLAIATNPYWLPPPRSGGAWMTRAVDGERSWQGTAPAWQRMIVQIFSAALFALFAWAWWTRHVVLGIGATAAIVAFRLVFFHFMVSRQDGLQPPRG